MGTNNTGTDVAKLQGVALPDEAMRALQAVAQANDRAVDLAAQQHLTFEQTPWSFGSLLALCADARCSGQS